MINPEVYVKVFNLLDFLDDNCNNLININCGLIPSDNNQQNSINKNIEALAVVQNKIIEIREEFARQTKKHITILREITPGIKAETKITTALKTLEMLSAEILDEKYYVNQNGRIIK
jgi:hypothetical protein